ncbi:MAG TPA: thioredoxin domain-containing protein [Sphingobacteriaceae bacterium]|nr:thioredoxin domain-containing protein [Sphingobacteriaceae bacterium]
MANLLGNEHSPYLKQHQNNPVHWQAWGAKALAQARAENKLIIVSIGYSTCHWCHVMERESFEMQDVADLMNAHFISIKVDREERPDIDQIFMTAVQLMTGRGGWPLNCICLPDGRPIYGGTYFRKEEWLDVLSQLQQMWTKQPEMAVEYAEKLTKGIAQSERVPTEHLAVQKSDFSFQVSHLQDIVKPWKAQFDPVNGGLLGAPKFPMPNNWESLLQYAVLLEDQEVLDHVNLTLKNMASGGIYDHVGGGFARYSVDERWHVPHFEKMLYDNAQLVSLYLSAYQQNKDPQYKRIVIETLDWVKREMTDSNGGFYCALDADSEGVEGKFYTFTSADFEEIRSLPENDPHKLADEDLDFLWLHFNCTKRGNWPEEGTNVFFHDMDADNLAAEQGFTEAEWDEYLQGLKFKLYAFRSKRIRPGLDNKQLTAWNALMIKAYCESYRVLHDEEYLKSALRATQFLQERLRDERGKLLHQPTDSNRSIPAFLDDYAFTIEAFIQMYEVTFDEQWLVEAKRLVEVCLTHFYNPEEGVFYYTSDEEETFIARKYELMDNVIPASNSALLRSMQKLGVIFDEPKYQNIITGALMKLLPQITQYGTAFSNWAILLLHETLGWYEFILSGTETDIFRLEIDAHYIPNKIVLGGEASVLPLLKDRVSTEAKAYVCKNRTCSLPVKNAQQLMELIN